jgi:PAS domain S-box-containing protein
MDSYDLGELARILFEESGSALFLKDTSFHVVAANPRFCEALGRSELDILGKTDFDLYPAALAEKLRAEDRRVLMEGQRLEVETQTLIRGRMRAVRIIKTPVRDSQNRIIGVLGSFGDVTEQHALEEQLRQAQKMEAIGQLAGGVAHDFNNLLTAILGNLSLLQNNLPPNDPQRPLVEAAERAAWRAANLTRQLLGFSRRTVLHPEPLNANTTVNEVVSFFKRTIDPRIALQTRKTPDLWLVHADPDHMSQVLMNLCLNARDAVQPLLDAVLKREPADKDGSANGQTNAERSPRTATILLETDNVVLGPAEVAEHVQGRTGEFVRLRVRDNGIGIAPEAQPRIFEPFFTTKGKGKGTGLGLAMVFGIVQQHHGWIECHSVLGQGTCFDIYLPRQLEPVVSSAPRTPQRKPAGGHETILLADDEPLVRNLGRIILESFGYHVLLAGDGQQAIDLYRREHPRIALVILDLTMPRLSGREVLHRLLEINPDVRVLFASGYSAEHLSAEDREHILGFISKPYRPDDFARAVRAALDTSRCLLSPALT